MSLIIIFWFDKQQYQSTYCIAAPKIHINKRVTRRNISLCIFTKTHAHYRKFTLGIGCPKNTGNSVARNSGTKISPLLVFLNTHNTNTMSWCKLIFNGVIVRLIISNSLILFFLGKLNHWDTTIHSVTVTHYWKLISHFSRTLFDRTHNLAEHNLVAS